MCCMRRCTKRNKSCERVALENDLFGHNRKLSRDPSDQYQKKSTNSKHFKLFTTISLREKFKQLHNFVTEVEMNILMN